MLTTDSNVESPVFGPGVVADLQYIKPRVFSSDVCDGQRSAHFVHLQSVIKYLTDTSI